MNSLAFTDQRAILKWRRLEAALCYTMLKYLGVAVIDNTGLSIHASVWKTVV